MKTINLVSRIVLAASMAFIFTLSAIAKEDNQTNEILTAYLAVKDALVKTDAKTASSAASNLVAAVGDSNNELMVKIVKNAKAIESSNDVKAQRKSFNDLSENVYQLMKGIEDLGIPVYRQYCPMAFNNTGAYWLAAEKEINNPYFGSMMLHCGVVKEEL